MDSFCVHGDLLDEISNMYDDYFPSPDIVPELNLEINEEESDKENESDQSECLDENEIQTRARRFLTTDAIGAISQDDEPTERVFLPIDIDMQIVDEQFSKHCGCSRNCYNRISNYKDAIYDYRLTLREFSNQEKDILILSKLEQMEYSSGETRKGKRQSNRYNYTYQGHAICEGTWRFVHDIGSKSLQNLKKHYKENGVAPRVHGNAGKKAKNAYPFEVVQKVVNFIKQYGDEQGLPMPSAPRGNDNVPIILLPCQQSKKYVHSVYMSACIESQERFVGITLFKMIWNQCLPHIRFLTPRTDICKTCQTYRQQISSAVTEDEKLRFTRQFTGHIESAQKKRDFYKQCTIDAKEELADRPSPINQNIQPCSEDLYKVHYTFDFSQSVTIPHSSQQIGALYFLTPRKVHIFGVCDEHVPLQTNYLINESETIGENGTRSHGPNSVVTMLGHYLGCNGYGEKACNMHADNCAGQNKNKTLIHYLAWRCGKGLHKSIQLHFMEAGHTKCMCDACFGLLKKRYRRSDCNSINQLASEVDKSASCNRAQLKSTEGLQVFQWRRWDEFFNRFFQPIKGIRKYHHFRVTCDEPGVVFMRRSLDDAEVRLQLRKSSEANIDECFHNMPHIIPPAGLTQERQRYLYRQIRPFVHPEFRDVTCPAPTEE